MIVHDIAGAGRRSQSAGPTGLEFAFKSLPLLLSSLALLSLLFLPIVLSFLSALFFAPRRLHFYRFPPTGMVPVYLTPKSVHLQS